MALELLPLRETLPTMMHEAFLFEARAALPEGLLTYDERSIAAGLRDNSWLSPVLEGFFQQRRDDTDAFLNVLGVARPEDREQLCTLIQLAWKHEVPLVPRGGGTSNFGQIFPVKGGIILDMTRLNRVLEVTDTSVTVEAGCIQGEADARAQEHDRELTLMTTTFGSATAAGWVCGGHVGLGADRYGTIWDGNVRSVRLLTAEEQPREIYLEGADLNQVLHTYGTTGVLTEVTFPLIPARNWADAIGVFPDFESAVAFVDALNEEPELPRRCVTAQEPGLAPSFLPMQKDLERGEALVLMIIGREWSSRAAEICRGCGGRFRLWGEGGGAESVRLSMMVYGHRMLWVKKAFPTAAFLHIYFTPGEHAAQMRGLKERFGEDVLLEHKYINSGWIRGLLGLSAREAVPACLTTIDSDDPEAVDRVMAYCRENGIHVLNPHTLLLEESGLFPDFAPIAAFQERVDPRGILNPGKSRERAAGGTV